MENNSASVTDSVAPMLVHSSRRRQASWSTSWRTYVSRYCVPIHHFFAPSFLKEMADESISCCRLP